MTLIDGSSNSNFEDPRFGHFEDFWFGLYREGDGLMMRRRRHDVMRHDVMRHRCRDMEEVQ